MKTQLIALLTVGSFLLSNCTSNKKPEKSATVLPASTTHPQVLADTMLVQEEETEMEENEMEGYTPDPLQALEAVAVSQENAQQFLKKHNLSSVWMGTIHSDDASVNVFNGFYGADRYRIEMYFASVEKDAKQPHIYHVFGKSRFKENIVPFEGKITIESISYIQDPNLEQTQIEDSGFKDLLMAKGRFELKEEASYKGSGEFAGDVFIDLGIRKFEGSYEENEIDTWTSFYKAVSDESGVQLTGMSRGAGFLLDGNWTSYETNKSKPVLVAKDIFLISNDILENFMIGERDVVINPKYRKLGWDNYWSNEEWWNEPKPIL